MSRLLPLPPAPLLRGDEIHVWTLEYARGEGREPLRRVLGSYLGAEPQAIGLVSDPHGRPRLVGDGPDFNWSHSGDRALVAVAGAGMPVGIDLELHRPRPRALQVAERFFDPGEHARLLQLAPSLRAQAFLDLWTAKEAVLKAYGRGLAYGMHRVAFDWLEPGTVRPARFSGGIGAAEGWTLHGLGETRSSASLAWHGGPRRVLAVRPGSGSPGTSPPAAGP